MLADLTSGEGDANAGVLRFAVALAGILFLCLGQQQGEHGVGIQNPDLCHGGTLIAGIEMLGVATDLMVDQVVLRLLVNLLQFRGYHLDEKDDFWVGLVQLISVPKLAIALFILIDAPVYQRVQHHQIRIVFVYNNAIFHFSQCQLSLIDL